MRRYQFSHAFSTCIRFKKNSNNTSFIVMIIVITVIVAATTMIITNYINVTTTNSNTSNNINDGLMIIGMQKKVVLQKANIFLWNNNHAFSHCPRSLFLESSSLYKFT